MLETEEEIMGKLKKYLENAGESTYLTCSVCGRGMTYMVKGKTIGGVTLRAVRDAGVYGSTSRKMRKGKVVRYVCDACSRRGK